MADIRLEVFTEKNYSNSDAYKFLLSYVGNKYSIAGYGFYPYDITSIIHQFEQSEANSSQFGPRKLWHFDITFRQRYSDNVYLTVADYIAKLFANEYQVLYGLDKDIPNRAPHLHFAVNAFSYHPTHPKLDADKMAHYADQSIKLLKSFFPYSTTRLKFERKDW